MGKRHASQYANFGSLQLSINQNIKKISFNIYPDNPFFISQNSFKKVSKSSCGETPNRPFNRPFALVTESEVV